MSQSHTHPGHSGLATLSGIGTRPFARHDETDIPPHVKRRRANGDPTGTKTVRRQYAAQLTKRYRALMGAVRELVVERDFFGVAGGRATRDGPAGANATGSPNRPEPLPAPDVPLPTQPGYTFPSDDARISRFRSWLDDTADHVVLGTQDPLSSDVWTDDYVRYSYGRGIMHADASLQFQGIDAPQTSIADAFSMPIHQSTLSMFYRRQYDALKGVNDAMGRQISQALTESLLEGTNPRDAARVINDRVAKIGLTRAHMVARTESIWATNEAALFRYEQVLGDTADVTIVAEFTNAGDNRVCAECQALGGTRYKLKDAHNVVPVHPNCRCVWIPIQAM